MSHLRHQIALDVGASFLPAKRQAIDAAAASFECVATLLKARQRARFAPDEAGDVVALAVEAANASFAAQDALYRVHARLAEYRAAWQIAPGAVGPDDTVAPERTAPTLTLAAQTAA